MNPTDKTGANAGKIYNTLKRQSPLTAENLRKQAAIQDIEEFHRALVWLSSQLLIISESTPARGSRFLSRDRKAEVYYRLSR